MELRNVGPLLVSPVGLGCNNFGRKLDADATSSVVDAALGAGINFFDTADVYGYGDHPYSGRGRSEEMLGKALGARRKSVIVATKFGMQMGPEDATTRGGSRRWVREACDDSLRRLRTDYIDLYQLHRPDPETPISETLGALNELVEQGKVRVIGCSNFDAAQLAEARAASRELGTVHFESVQNEYSLLTREAEDEVLPACAEMDIAFLPYFPLASGLLTGKYRKGAPAPDGTRLSFWTPRAHQALDDETLERVEKLAALAQASGHTILELAVSWLLTRPQVASVIAGATSPDQVRANAAAAAWTPAPGQLDAIEAI